MDSPDRTTTDSLPLEELVALAQSELERLGYGKRTRNRFRATWRRLIAFAQASDLGDRYSEELATRFVDASRPPVGERLGPGDHWRRSMAYDIKVLGDVNRGGRIVPFETAMLKASLPPAMLKPLQDYERHCAERLHLRPCTVIDRTREIAQFLYFVGSKNRQTLQEMQADDIAAFVVSRPDSPPSTVARYVSSVRLFLEFLLMRGTLREDLSRALPKVRVVSDAAIPSAWDPELLVELLTVVDRSSPKGKRDYAILLLAARLGLRVGDIRTLRLDDLDWEAATVDVTQSKTGGQLRLPLSDEVGEALIDYLRFGRPKTERREVFLKMSAPFEPFSENAHLHHIMARWCYAAGIDYRRSQKLGLHSLRHTLATQLLRAETPIHVISEILGHATTGSTLIYAKADTEGLRSVALDPQETRHE